MTTEPTTQPAEDPTHPPMWLIEGARGNGVAMGFLASGYLAGIEAARRSGACGREHPGVDRVCALHHGHPGAHSTVAPLVWGAAPEEASA